MDRKTEFKEEFIGLAQIMGVCLIATAVAAAWMYSKEPDVQDKARTERHEREEANRADALAKAWLKKDKKCRELEDALAAMRLRGGSVSDQAAVESARAKLDCGR